LRAMVAEVRSVVLVPGQCNAGRTVKCEGPAAMLDTDLMTVAAGDGRDLLTVAQSDWSLPVPSCPGWDASDVVGHTGAILGWIARIVSSGQAVPRSEREAPPADRDVLAAWFSAHLERTVHILVTTPPESAAWTFSSRGDRRVGWWRRRIAVELAIHRWDVQAAASADGPASVPPLDGEVAAAGVAEYLTEFLPGLLAQPDVRGLSGTLHLHSIDGGSEWWVDLDAKGAAAAVQGHCNAGTAIRATRSDQLLWLTNRKPADALEVLGRADVAARWTRLCR
jgi:uncharacterized protein (TIGR03083 family)